MLHSLYMNYSITTKMVTCLVGSAYEDNQHQLTKEMEQKVNFLEN